MARTLRERVAERQRLEAASVNAGPPSADDVRRDRIAGFWKRVANVGTAVQWLAMLALLVEAYFIWTKDPNVVTDWSRVLVFAIILGGARLVRIGGTILFKRYR